MNTKLKLDELNRVSLEEFKNKAKHPVTIVLDDIRSLNNIGTFFRTGDAFCVEKIILCGITAQPPHREIQKTALGATESVDWEYIEKAENAVLKLQNENVKVYAVEQTSNSISLEKFEQKEDKIALIFGNEVNGVQQNVIDICNGSIEIPQFGTKHSFNVSVSAGIVLWEVIKKIALKK